jgi:hypothetical protein
MGFSFISAFDVGVGDTLSFFNGETKSATTIATVNGGKTLPGPTRSTSPATLVSWAPNKDGSVGKGYVIGWPSLSVFSFGPTI